MSRKAPSKKAQARADHPIRCTACGETFAVRKESKGTVQVAAHETSVWFAERENRWFAACSCGEVDGFSIVNLLYKLEARGDPVGLT